MIPAIQQAASSIQHVGKGMASGFRGFVPGTVGQPRSAIPQPDPGTSQAGIGGRQQPPEAATTGIEYDSAPLSDPGQEALELIEDKTALRANLAVIKTADQMIGTLLDTWG